MCTQPHDIFTVILNATSKVYEDLKHGKLDQSEADDLLELCGKLHYIFGPKGECDEEVDT